MSDIATPGLNFVGELSAKVASPVDIGTIPQGLRRIVPMLSGEITGPLLNGKLLPGGTDYQVWRSDGITEIHARYVIETASGARIYVEASGLRRAPPEVMHNACFAASPSIRPRSTSGPCRGSRLPIRNSHG